ncbi:hypothetical protein [Methanobacterium sp.]
MVKSVFVFVAAFCIIFVELLVTGFVMFVAFTCTCVTYLIKV